MKFIIVPSTLVAFALFFSWVPIASAATLLFDAPAKVSVGEVFSLKVLVDSKERGFNAAEAALLFQNDVLEVISVDSAPSGTVFNFWLSMPSFSNEKGVISFSGGTTRGIVGSAIQILTLRMRAAGSGEAVITASDASINASDGSGTNILDSIVARRIVVSEALTTIPQKPAPSPVPKPPVESKLELVKELEGKSSKQVLFYNRELRFPVIEEVSPRLRGNISADIFVSGAVSEGNHVHLLLRRGAVSYKEITAIVKQDGSWEGLLGNIYAYGTYTLDAWVETADNTNKSQVVTWENSIDIYPPFTLHPFGYVLRWYATATAFLGALSGLLGALLIWQFFIMPHQKYRVTHPAVISFIISILAFIAMFAVAYVLWQKEYRSEASFWKDTDIPCVLRAHSFIDLFNSAELSILVNGEPQRIPTEVGFSPKCVALIHTLDDSGRIHFKHDARSMMLLDFFTVAGEPLKRDGYTLSVTINGKDHTDDADSYALQNGDVIVVTYNSVK